jgi:peptide deformylase
MNADIIQDGHPTLRTTAKKVAQSEFNTKQLHTTISHMYAALYTQNDGVAIAAPQINCSKRIFVINEKIVGTAEDIPADTPTIYINPKIITKSKDRKKMSEGCLSVRPLYGKVKRASRIHIQAYDTEGTTFEVMAKGFLAQIIQHENDHLNGVLFIDTATDVHELDTRKSKDKEKSE